MALRKIIGVETEFGIIVARASQPHRRLVDPDQRLRARAGAGHRRPRAHAKVGWDFEDEHPDIDARGFSAEGRWRPRSRPTWSTPCSPTARYYVDHAHPECSTPECADPRSVVVYDKAAELILQRSMRAAVSLLPDGQEIIVHKNNSDGKGNSYGCHENYLMDRQVPFGRIVTHVMPHFISRQVFTGVGQGGQRGRGPHVRRRAVPDHPTGRLLRGGGRAGTLKRPIVNTRDEPHADAQRYRRLHVIVGDANLSETATFLKVGTTALVLSMIEDEFLPRDLTPVAPVAACARCPTT